MENRNTKIGIFKKIIDSFKNILLLIAVFIPIAFISEKFLSIEQIINGTRYIKKPEAGEIFIFSLSITVVVTFLYRKIAKRLNL